MYGLVYLPLESARTLPPFSIFFKCSSATNSPVLVVRVAPANDELVSISRRESRRLARKSSAVGLRNNAFDVRKTIPECRVERRGRATAREPQRIGPMAALPVCLCLRVSGVHVEVEFFVSRALVVDVAHEGSTGGGFVGGARHNHPSGNVLAGDAVDLVVDELAGGVEL